MSDDREKGYYWISLKAPSAAQEFIFIAFWDHIFEWLMPGDDVPISDDRVVAVSNRIDIPVLELRPNPGYRSPAPVDLASQPDSETQPSPMFDLPFLPEPGMVYQFNDALSDDAEWKSGGWRPCIRDGAEVVISGMKLWERTKEANDKAALIAFDRAAEQVQRGVRHAFDSFLDEAVKAGVTPHVFVQIGFDKK